MSSSKKVFVVIAVAFMLALVYVSYDISRKTTFPGSKPQLKERLKREFEQKPDSTDSILIK
jgi:hypothetical protein